jgi:hypothetical protein
MPDPSLILFTTSQIPLPTRYPHPHKPNLLIPPLVHRSLHSALDSTPPSYTSTNTTLYIPDIETLAKHDLPPTSPSTSTSTRPSVIDPNLDGQPPSTSFTESEVTAKLHFVSPSSPSTRLEWINDALATLSKYKGLTRIDNLLIGFKSIDYRGRKTAASEMFGCGAEGLESDVGSEDVGEDAQKDVVEIWRGLGDPNLNTGGEGKGEVGRFGTLYLPLVLLKVLHGLEKEGSVRVGINALDTPDCHHLPKEYTDFAKAADMELWAGGGGEGSGELFLFKEVMCVLGLIRP